MASRVAGFFLVACSLMGALFFRHYRGGMIAYPTAWYLLFVMAGLFGAWLIYNDNVNEEKGRITAGLEKAEKLRRNSEKIMLNFDFCEFKNGTGMEQITDRNIQIVKSLAPHGGIAELAQATQERPVPQSALVYHHQAGSIKEDFYSPTFPMDKASLEFYVLNNNLTLYVDRFDRKKYFFDLKQ